MTYDQYVADHRIDDAPARLAISDEGCRTFRHAAELAGRKWNAAIMLALASGASRFSEIREIVTGVSDRLLSLRLRELEGHRLVERTVIPTVPAQIRYELTASGSELIRILHPLTQWSLRWGFDDASPD